MMTSTNQFFWYELMTSDQEGAERFYAAVVGWTMTGFGAAGAPYTVLESQGRGIGGIMAMPPEVAQSGMRPGWVGYIHVADIDKAVAAIAHAGGVVHRPPAMIPQVGRFAVIGDPQGAIFNILQPESSEEMPPLAADAIGRTDWHELHAVDWQRALTFYESLFGWSGTGAMDMGPMGQYQFFAMEAAAEGAECGTTCGAMYNDPQVSHPHWLFYFHTDAIDAAVARVEANGGKLIHGPQEVPGGMWIVNALDPQGAVFALVAPQR